jgi:oxygen-independent coproporphyrinogen-3 oxidase
MAGLYLHIPFCRRKCSYCDFYSFVGSAEEILAYPDLLTSQLAICAEHDHLQPIETIYFGGGTPSLLSPAAIETLLNQAHKNFAVVSNAEITLEVNPGTVTYEQFAGYRSAGVNRLSLGLQSCSDQQLASLGRLHDHQDGLNAIDGLRRAGFDNLSLDLMFALPGQTLPDLDQELRTYLALSPEHLSCYGLTAEPMTPLREQVEKGLTELPDEDFYAEAFLLIHDRLTAAGYEHYEIANYAKQGLRCKHNEAYWQRKPYLGVGAGAHSFHADGWGSRWQVPNDLKGYQKAIAQGRRPEVLLESFDRQSALKETIYLALRTGSGLLDTDLQSNFNCSLREAFPDAVERCSNWLNHEAGRWTLTPHGWLIFDNLIQHFL